MNKIKYLLDENVSINLRKALKKRLSEIVVLRIGDPNTPTFGTLDPEILVWCEEKGFLLVTNNRASMPVHLQDHLAAGRHASGIFILNDNMSLGETVEELILIWEASDAEEYFDQLWHLPVT